MNSMRQLMAALGSAGVLAGVAAPAMAGDLLLTRHDATFLIESDVGKPYWTLQAQCAGVFGAAYAYETAQQQPAKAQAMKDNGVAMLESAIARLRYDRSLDRGAALTLAADEVEHGRAIAKTELDRSGVGPDSGWNWLRSACLDIAGAERRHEGVSD